MSTISKVLVIDDSKLTRALITQALHHCNLFDIRFAEDGEDAQGQMDGVDLVISDWLMPRMDGIEFTRWLRAQEAYRHLPVLLITANFGDADIEHAREAGVDMFIEKTFCATSLIRALEKLTASGMASLDE